MKILFLIPLNNQNPTLIFNHIRNFFPKSLILIQGNDLEVNIERYLAENVIYFYTESPYLFEKLLAGYINSIKYEYDYLIRIDPDVEYRLNSIHEYLSTNDVILTNSYYGGFKRSVYSNGLLDSIFNTLFGFLEGYILIKEPFIQHSPSLIVISKPLVTKFIEGFNLYKKLNTNWGFDLLTIYWLHNNSNLKYVNSPNPFWKERRPPIRIFKQMVSSIRILLFIITNKQILK